MTNIRLLGIHPELHAVLTDYDASVAELAEKVNELLALREQSGRLPVLEADLRKRLEPLARMHTLNGEKRACAVFDAFLASKAFDVLGDDVERVIPEFQLGSVRVDRALFHRSGRLTLVEIKDCASPREIVAGIGQAVLYAAIAERELDANPIVPVLVVLGASDPDISRACQRAGVEYIALGDVSWLRTISEIIAASVFGIT